MSLDKIKYLEKKLGNVLENNKVQDSSTVEAFPRVLSGIFEIHITIDTNGGYIFLIDYVKNSPRNMKIVYAAANSASQPKGNNQLMISHFTRETDDKYAIDIANEMAEDMRKHEMKVIRVKVESHGASGTPMTNYQFNVFSEYIRDRYSREDAEACRGQEACHGDLYFEFHVKISRGSIRKIEEDLRGIEKHGVLIGVSYNMLGKSGKPLLTIRVNKTGFFGAERIKDSILNRMKELGYTFEGKIQQEFAIYDTNSEIDNGWLMDK